jgi:hypothetical protein
VLKTKYILVFLLLSFTFFSCRKDFERANWDVDLLAPLIKTTLNLQDLLPDSVIQTNPDTTLKLVYQTNIFDVDMDSLYRIPDTTISDVYTFTLSSVASPGSSFYTENNEIKLNITNGVELNYALIESGFIEIEVFSEIKEKIIVSYKIPSITKNGDTLMLTEVIDAATISQDGYFIKKIDISGYELDLTGVSQSEVNTMITVASGTVDTNAAGPVTISSGEKITYNNKLIDIVPYFVRGYFGNQQLHYGPETTTLNIFDKIVSGTLDLDQVDVNIEFKNGIGVDAQLILDQFTTLNTNTPSSATLGHSVIGAPVNINRAQLTYTIPEVSYSSYNVAINTNNSNIDQLIEIFPNQLLYDIYLTINPFGNISGGNDFVYRKHSLETNLNVEFPLSLVANSLTLADTINFSLPDESETGRIIDGTLFLYANNGFPFSASMQLGMYDEYNNFIQSIPVNNQIQAAPVDGNLRVIAKKESVLSIPLNTNDVDNLYRAKKILLYIGFTTQPQSQFIKIYDGYEIDIQVVGDFSYNVSFK